MWSGALKDLPVLAHGAPDITPRQPRVTNGEYELSEARVDIQIDTRFQQAFAAASLDRLLLDVAEPALMRELESGPDHVTLIITDDEALRKLNLEFMGYDLSLIHI